MLSTNVSTTDNDDNHDWNYVDNYDIAISSIAADKLRQSTTVSMAAATWQHPMGVPEILQSDLAARWRGAKVLGRQLDPGSILPRIVLSPFMLVLALVKACVRANLCS
jgi:hypothetical protein